MIEISPSTFIKKQNKTKISQHVVDPHRLQRRLVGPGCADV